MDTKLTISGPNEDGKVFEIADILCPTLIVYCKDYEDFKKCIKNKEKFIKDITDEIESFIWSKDLDVAKNYEIFFDYFNEIFDNILDEVTYINIKNGEEPLEYVNKYEELKNKKIALNNIIKPEDFDEINELLDKYKDNPNIYVFNTSDFDYIQLTECKKIIDEVKRMADYIKSFNLSPLENVMLTYDLVRNRVYTKEEGDDYRESRNLSNVLFGDAIVCVGYAKIVKAILENFNIPTDLIQIDVKENGEIFGHMRNAIYINDPKYNVRGYYYLDPTWDSRKGENNNYLYTYKNFLKTEAEIDKNEEEIEKRYDEFIEDIEILYEDGYFGDVFQFMRNINKIYKKYHNRNSKVFNPTSYMKHITDYKEKYDIEVIKKAILRLKEEVLTPISAETYLNLLNNVRKIEYYIDPEKYHYTDGVLYSALVNSNWKFTNEDEDAFFIRIFFGDTKTEKELEELIKRTLVKEYINRKTNISKDIEGVHLAKTLRKVLEKKEGE